MKQRSETNRKSQRINVRLTVDELMEVYAEAKLRGLSLSEFTREQLFTRPTRKRTRVAVVEGIDRRLWLQVRRIGVNLNQIARRLNSAEGIVVPPDLMPAIDLVRRVLELPIADPET